jgi:hypothetical protein
MPSSGTKAGREYASHDEEQDRRAVGKGAGQHSRRSALPRAAAFWLVVGVFCLLFFASAPIAVVQHPPGSAAVSGGHADCRSRGLCSRPSHHPALLRVSVGLSGPPRHPRRPHSQRVRVRVVPGGARHRSAVRRQGAAGYRRRRGVWHARRGADRAATRTGPARAGGHRRSPHPWPGSGHAGCQRACPVRAGAIPEGCRWAAGRTASWRCCVSAPAMNRPGS